ncbi:hypothetical protein ACFQXA_37640 [Nocardiopsis composta]
MHLLVLHDMARMPRTRAALTGMDPGRPWSEVQTQLALLDTRLQALYGLLWVGLRIKGKPPEPKPYPAPQPKAHSGGEEKTAPVRRADPARWPTWSGSPRRRAAAT